MDSGQISDSYKRQGIPIYNEKSTYPMNVYHLNSGMGYNFKKGSIIPGMQFTYRQDINQKQTVNLTRPVEYIRETIMPL